MARVIACVLGLLAVAAPAAADAASFRSPSGNIGCMVTKQYARCDMLKRDFKAPKQPASCDAGWGQYFNVNRRSSRGLFICVSDTVMDMRASKLAYGKSVTAGTMRCTSRTEGVRCVNGRGHGFEISRQAYKLL